MFGRSCTGRGKRPFARRSNMQEEQMDRAEQLSEQLERDVRRYPRELEEEKA